ncbi:PhoX family protein [Sulfurospirillum arcachonense]|uniref:PhoX family protein n=1 Tax=Sulfurospirillum arcachonense TaxID=57666 RepID=UPI00046A29BD|nr:alkaline phosphatase PhoX [Sulfurospirillum arcachonense]
MNYKLLGLSTIVASLLVGCTASPQVSNTQKHSISFQEVSVPTTDKEKREVRASKEVTIDGKTYPIDFHTILRSGEKSGSGTFGLLFDKKGNTIRNTDGSLRISNSNDYTSLLPVGEKIFMVNHFESRPAAMYLTELEQQKDGNLKAINTRNIDFSQFNGLWVPCAGSITPWNTHIGSEEYEPNAAKVKENGSINAYYDAMGAYVNGDLNALNPYDYGWTPEIKVLNEKGDVKVTKHYAMGRFSHELAYVMPDNKTVFLTDDGTNVALFMFIADEEEKLDAGVLYAAKWIQQSSKNGGKAYLQWVNLGHATSDEIKLALDKKITFKDIFDSSKEYPSINTTMGQENLKVKANMEKIASRLESRRYASLKGATTEFRKMEGFSYNQNNHSIYIAMSSIGKGMEDNKKKNKPNTKYDKGGHNDIKLPYNPCGTVYKLSIGMNTPLDLDGNVINSSFVPNMMIGEVSGFQDKSVKGNTCALSSLANPDNISYIPNTSTLLIGEDTGSGHQNDFVWAYNLDDKKLTRIETTPYGSETTSLYFNNNVKGYGYIMSVVQHPYGEGDALTKEKDMPNIANSKGQMMGYTGYIGPLPVINK